MHDLLTAIGGPVRLPGGQIDIELSAGIAAGPCTRPTAAGCCAARSTRCAGPKATESEVEVYDPAQDVGRDFGPRLLPELIGALDNGLIVTFVRAHRRPDSGTAVDPRGEAALGAPRARCAGRRHAAPAGRARRPDPRLTRVLMADAVRRCAWWRSGGLELGVTLDLTTTDVLDSRLPYELARLVSEAGVPPAVGPARAGRGPAAGRPARTRRALSQLRTLGVRLALDHYGRSAPSFTRLRTLPVQELKLDRSFVASA
jgi:hypothetical protein